MNNYEECGEIDPLGVRRQLVESGGDLSYVKGRKVKTMDRGALRRKTSPPYLITEKKQRNACSLWRKTSSRSPKLRDVTKKQ